MNDSSGPRSFADPTLFDLDEHGEPRRVVPAFSLFKFGDDKPKPWAVTTNDFGPGADRISTIVMFETEAEALAFIAENAPERKQ